MASSGIMAARAGRAVSRALVQGAGLVLALLVGPAPAAAIQGGASARSGDALARASVGIGIVTQTNGKARVTRCSGVLIGSDLVLTAAHCVGGDPLGLVVVFYRGSTPVKPVYTASVVSRYSPDRGALAPGNAFEGSLSELSADLAVLRLSSPVRDRVPVPLATDRGRVPASLQIAGIGLSGRTGGRLRTAALRPIAATSSGLTIAQTLGSRACFGDSGGPVVGRDGRGVYVYGVASAVISRSPPCGDYVVIAPASQIVSGRR